MSAKKLVTMAYLENGKNVSPSDLIILNSVDSSNCMFAYICLYTALSSCFVSNRLPSIFTKLSVRIIMCFENFTEFTLSTILLTHFQKCLSFND